jgi:hypothetical protein
MRVLLVAFLALCASLASLAPFAAERAAQAVDAAATTRAVVRVPQTSALYRLRVERAAAEFFGLAGPLVAARLGSQLHAESAWNPSAHSPANAQGLGQFVPETAEWLPQVCPTIGVADPWNPNWAIRAASCYDAYLFVAVDGATLCERWAFVFSAYNGGLTWVRRDKKRASSLGLDPARWFGHVETTSARADWARAENRAYVRKILLDFEPAYIAAGWSGQAVCP